MKASQIIPTAIKMVESFNMPKGRRVVAMLKGHINVSCDDDDDDDGLYSTPMRNNAIYCLNFGAECGYITKHQAEEVVNAIK